MINSQDLDRIAPWNRLVREPGEAAIDFACRKVEAMVTWHAARSQDTQAIGAACRRIELREGQEAARTYFREATAALYRTFSEC